MNKIPVHLTGIKAGEAILPMYRITVRSENVIPRIRSQVMVLRFLVFSAFLFASATACAQVSNVSRTPTNAIRNESGFLSMDQFFGSAEDGAAFESSITETMEQMKLNMNRDPVRIIPSTTFGDALKALAIEETTVPETNKNIVESVDQKTQRYSPRLSIDFRLFPLQRATTKFTGSKINADSMKQNIGRRLGVHDVEFSLQNRTMTLTGTVPSEHERQMVEMMVRLEPGVDHICNELVIKPIPNAP